MYGNPKNECVRIQQNDTHHRKTHDPRTCAVDLSGIGSIIPQGVHRSENAGLSIEPRGREPREKTRGTIAAEGRPRQEIDVSKEKWCDCLRRSLPPREGR